VICAKAGRLHEVQVQGQRVVEAAKHLFVTGVMPHGGHANLSARLDANLFVLTRTGAVHDDNFGVLRRQFALDDLPVGDGWWPTGRAATLALARILHSPSGRSFRLART